jgi:hypothetical protein
MAETRAFRCAGCEHVWEVPFGRDRPEGCPSCQSKNFQPAQVMRTGSGASGGHGRRDRHRAQGGNRRGRRGGRAAG